MGFGGTVPWPYTLISVSPVLALPDGWVNWTRNRVVPTAVNVTLLKLDCAVPGVLTCAAALTQALPFQYWTV